MVVAEAASARPAALQRTMLLCCGKEGGREGGMRLSDSTSIRVDACPRQRAGVQTQGCMLQDGHWEPGALGVHRDGGWEGTRRGLQG